MDTLFDVRPIAEGEFVGRLGERISVSLRCTEKVMQKSGYYLSLYRFVDDDGLTYVYWCSRGEPFKVGRTYRLSATVKRHKVYRGVRQTTIERPLKLKRMQYQI
jgi:hypothetical protein